MSLLAFWAFSIATLALGVVYAIQLDASDFSKIKFDFIVVGAGTAGTVVATRLSEVSSFRVGLIEAGNYHKDDPMILVPNLNSLTHGDAEYAWNFNTVPQKAFDNRSLVIVQGKGVGGSSQVNDAGFTRAGAVEYDLVGELGNPGWSWNTSLYYLKKVENVSVASPDIQRTQSATVDLRFRGTSGPIHSRFSSFFSEAIPLFYSAMNSLGLTTPVEVGDGRDAEYVGNALCSVDPETNTRSYAATGYYEPNSHRPNLILLTGAKAIKVLLSESRDTHGNLNAQGVEYVDLKTSRRYIARASREVVVSAGAVQSPHLLELSGIGNKTLLSKYGLRTYIDNPMVGENYQDHIILNEAFEINNTIQTWDIMLDPAKNASAFNEFLQNKTGVYGSCITALSYISARHLADPETLRAWTTELDREFNATNPSKGARIMHEIQKRRLLPTSQETTFESYAVPVNPFPETMQPNKSYIHISAIPQHPFSRGSIHITSADPLVPPAIDLNAFGLSIDRHIMIAASKFVRRVSQTMPLRQIIRADVKPIELTSTDEQWLEHIKETVTKPFHPCCTVAMLPKDLGGVLDSKLIVYGTSNLRVVDISTLPFLLGTHLMATAYSIGERAADLIKEAHSPKHH